MPTVAEYLAPIGRLFRYNVPTSTNGHAKAVSGSPRVANHLPVEPEYGSIYKIVEEMLKDYQVSFCERILIANITAVKVSVAVSKDTPQEDSALANAAAESLQELWDESLGNMMESIRYGRVAHEKVWGYEEPEINESGTSPSFQTIRKLEPLPFNRTKLCLEDGKYGGVEAKVKDGSWQHVSPDNSWWLALNATTSQPHGYSRFVPAPYEVFKDKQKAKKNRTTASSKWAVRGPVFRGPITDVDEQTQESFDVLARMSPALEVHSKGGALYLPNDSHSDIEGAYKYTVEQPELKGFDPNALNGLMERLDVEMLRAFGIPEQTVIEAGAVGTYGSIAQKMLILFATIEEILKEFVKSYKLYVVEKVEEVNGIPKGTIVATFVSLTNRPDSFVFEIVKILLANPSFIEVILSGGLDVKKILEQAGLPVTQELQGLMLAVAQRLAAVGAAQAAAAGAGQPAPGQPAPLSPGEFGDMGRRQFTNNVKAIRDILNDFQQQINSEAITRELLESLGLAPERVERLLDDVKDNGVIDDPELQEAAISMSDEPLDALTLCGGEGGKPGPCPSGVSESKTAGSRTHRIKLPKNPTKLTIKQTHQAMSQMGYKLGRGSYDLKTKITTYEVELPDGTKARMPTTSIKKLIYEGAGTALSDDAQVLYDIIDDYRNEKSSETITRELLESLGIPSAAVDSLIDKARYVALGDSELQEAAKAMSDEASDLLARMVL